MEEATQPESTELTQPPRKLGWATFFQLMAGTFVAGACVCVGFIGLALLCLEISLTMFGMQQRAMSSAVVIVPLVMIAVVWVLAGTLIRYAKSLRTSPGDPDSVPVEESRLHYVYAVVGALPVLALCVWMLFGTMWLRD